MLNPFYVILPELSDQPLVVDANNPKSLKRWLKQLTTLKQGMIYRLLCERIDEINKTKFDSPQLEQILKLIQPYYSATYETLLHQILRDRQPNCEERRKTSDLLLTLCQEFTLCYWVMLQSFKFNKKGWGRNKSLADNIIQLMQCYSEVLTIYYLMGLQEPAWIWFDLNSLYLFSRKNKIHTIKIKTERTKINHKTTIEETFKQILLIHMVDPYCLSKQELIDILILTEKWSALAKISRHGSKWDSQLSGWTIDLDQDKPPYWLDESQVQGPVETRYLIDLKAILRLLSGQRDLSNHHLGRFESASTIDDNNGVLTYELLAYLERRSSGESSSHLATFNEDEEQLFTIGLNTIHQQISASSAIEDAVAGECLTTAIAAHELSYKSTDPTHFSVGSLIGYKPIKDLEGDVQLGIVQRIRSDSLSNTTHFQIRQLNNKTYAAGIQPGYSKKKLDIYQRALLYIDNSENQAKTVLIAKSKNIRESDVLRLLFRNQSILIKILSRKSIALGCYLFECEKLTEPGHSANVGTPQSTTIERVSAL